MCFGIVTDFFSFTGVQKLDNFLTHSYHHIDTIYSTIRATIKNSLNKNSHSMLQN